jgi:hypothetical protein
MAASRVALPVRALPHQADGVLLQQFVTAGMDRQFDIQENFPFAWPKIGILQSQHLGVDESTAVIAGTVSGEVSEKVSPCLTL